MRQERLKAVVIEDETLGLQALITLIKSCTDLKIAGQASDIISGVKVIMEKEPDIVFLDVRLGNQSGFDILKQVSYRNFSLIITSAYQEYALEAIKEEVVDYLLKPVMKDDLLKAIQRIRERKNNSIQEQWPAIQKSIDRIAWDKMAIPTGTGLSFVSISQILRCEAEGAYTKLVLKASMPLMSTRNLGEFEGMLSPDIGFMRVHHNVIVNMKEVLRYVRGEGGQIVMTDGETVEISRRKKMEFVEWLEKYS